MKQFRLIETVEAAFITRLSLSAVLDDNTNVDVPLIANPGDAVIKNIDGTFTHYSAKDFAAKYELV